MSGNEVVAVIFVDCGSADDLVLNNTALLLAASQGVPLEEPRRTIQ
jgi:hypothetical protein